MSGTVSTRYLITGATGMLGTDLQVALAGREVTALARADLDITDLDAVLAAAAGHHVIVNTAAYTRVDDAESHEDEAYLVNAVGARNLAIAASEVGARLVQVSTDYVFDGSATSPYPEGHERNPLSAYGRTKAAGEVLAMENCDSVSIVRAAWLYGVGGPNFAKTMVRLAGANDTVSVVTDQRGQPTWTADLARQIVALLDADAAPGIYHGTNSGEATWFDFTREIFRVTGLDPERVLPTTSAQFVRPAPRPDYSVLGHHGWLGTGVEALRDWREALVKAEAAGALRG